MRTIEIYGANQKQLENTYHNKIRELNASLKKMYVIEHNWKSVDEKYVRVYNSRENFHEKVIVPLLETRRYYIYKLNDVRRGEIRE